MREWSPLSALEEECSHTRRLRFTEDQTDRGLPAEGGKRDREPRKHAAQGRAPPPPPLARPLTPSDADPEYKC